MSSFASVPAITHGDSLAVGSAAARSTLAAFSRSGDAAAALLASDLHPLLAWSDVFPSVAAPEVAEAAPPHVGCHRQIALDVIGHSRRCGFPFSFVAVDGAYGHLPWLPRELDIAGETFLVEMHPDRAVFLDDPMASAPAARDERLPLVRASLRLRDKAAPTSAIAWTSVQPPGQWRRLSLADPANPRRKLRADYLTRRVWVRDDNAPSAEHWHLLVRRAMSGASLRFCLSNAAPDACLRDLAEMLERAISSREPAKAPRAHTAWYW